MKIFRKTIISLCIVLFFTYHSAYAGIFINEIMYSLDGGDEDREWIEIYNDADVSMDLSSFSFFEAKTNHKLVLVQGNKNIGAQGYVVIIDDPIKFKTDWPNFVGTIFDSSFSLSNSGETLAIKNGNKIIDEYSYQSASGGAGDGKSLQKINGVWVSAMPTPGLKNKITFIPPPISKNKSIVSNKDVENKVETQISGENLTTGILEDDIAEEDKDLYLFIIILIFLLGISGGAIYFVRKKKVGANSGDDFEILNE